MFYSMRIYVSFIDFVDTCGAIWCKTCLDWVSRARLPRLEAVR
jgi:hypothetical protein